ncbi:MAG: 2-hydroxyacid dehydrogenase [Acidobacteria bacterium]|nr:2-hydroxyacid dehydrogenase [Acidobacteriota bacterium]MCI0724457.1 2-hydroxyacid dehydrogenase [Acidobacteriota bacterium]
MKILCIGDAMIPGADITAAARRLGSCEVVGSNWESDWERLQSRRLMVEKQGPSVEEVPGSFIEHPDAAIALGLFCPFSAQGMDAFQDLHLIGIARAGFENLDVAAATQRGIIGMRVLGRNAEAVAEFTVGLMLSETRNIARAHLAIKQGTWRKQFNNSANVPELKGKTVGIVGFGRIGRLVVRKLANFGVKLLISDPSTKPGEVVGSNAELVGMDRLVAESDVISLHARLTETSRGLIGRAEFQRMKTTAYLINTARAGLVDMDALVETLEKHQIAGAALDVFDVEPLPANHPLLTLDNVTLTSHLAGTTREVITRSPELLLDEIKSLMDGQLPSSLVNPIVLKRPDVQEWLTRVRSSLTRGEDR